MSTPAQRFHADQPTGDELPLRLPAQLSSPAPAPLGPLELELVVPACGNLGLAGHQLWLGRRYAGALVRLWIDHQVIHLSADGRCSRPWPLGSPRLSCLPWSSWAPAQPARHQPASQPPGWASLVRSSASGW